jgi:Flp pilus assembly protein TadB
VRYGDSWTCDDCHRTWNTSRVPSGEYDQIRRMQLRFRLLPIALGLLVVAVAAFFTLTGNARGVFVLLPIALIVWFVFLRPSHRRRYRKAIAERQKWRIHEDR